MKQIKQNIKTNNYYSSEFINKYVYIKRQNNDVNIFHIFKINNLDPDNDQGYLIDKHYYFCIPSNDKIPCYVYNGSNKFEYSFKDELYILDYDEYLDTFREFIKNDGKLPNEVPSKIIQDKNY